MINSRSQPVRSVLAFDNFKEAALLFDRVLFPSIDRIQLGNVRWDFVVASGRRLSATGKETFIPSKSILDNSQDNEPVPISAILELVYGPSSGATIYNLYDHYGELMNAYNFYIEKVTQEKIDFLSKNPRHHWIRMPRTRSIADLYLRNEDISEGLKIRDYVEKLGTQIDIKRPALIIPMREEGPANQDRSVFANLSGIFRIDTRNVSWEQILEVRRDEESKEKLPYFRRWCETTLSTLPIEQIKDELYIAESNFKAACDKHGLRYRNGVISELLDEKALVALGGGIGALAAVANGVSTEAFVEQITKYIGSGAVGAGLAALGAKLGKIAITFDQKKLDNNDIYRNHPIAYLLDIHKKMDVKESGS